MYYVYIIENESSNKYIGYTSNLDLRISYHNKGFNKTTKNKGPWQLKYFEKFENKTEALKREKFLKKQKNREFYDRLIMSSGMGCY